MDNLAETYDEFDLKWWKRIITENLGLFRASFESHVLT